MSKVTLFVMTEKGLKFIEQAISLFKDIIEEVVIGQDTAVSNDYSSEIASACNNANVNFQLRSDFSIITSEYAMAISWRWLIKHPPEKLIVFHDSLLPKYRGFAPLVNALINGETTIGVTALFGATDYDRGEIIHQSSVAIRYPITISEAIKSISNCYLYSGLEVLKTLANGEPFKAQPQNEENATYSLWRDDDDYRIDWNQSATKIRRTIDAVGSPFKGASCEVNGVPARILAAVEIEDVNIENRIAGKVIFIEDSQPIIVCGTGLLKVISCQREEDGSSLLPLTKFRTRFT